MMDSKRVAHSLCYVYATKTDTLFKTHINAAIDGRLNTGKSEVLVPPWNFDH